jgi:polygalacturonase
MLCLRAVPVFLLCALAAVPTLGGAKVYDILDYGANPDGNTLCTTAIQKAIDEAAGGGGGTVRFPAGTFLSGALRMKSGVTLQIAEGATLLGSRNHDDYYGPPTDAEGREVEGDPVFRNLIHGEGLHDIAIRGKGAIDGNGDAFRDKTKGRTKCIYLESCRKVLIEDVRMRAAGSWMQHYRLCRDVTIRGIDVFNHVAFNNDGLNIDSCRKVSITGCRIDSDDDGIVLKSLSGDPCQNITVSDCVISSHCNGLKMGTESGGGFVDITISNCTVFSPKKSKATYGRDRGLAGIALEIVDGGRMDNITVSDVDIEGVSVPIFLRLGNRARLYGRDEKPGVGTLRNVLLKNITARGTSSIGCAISGLPGHRIENVRLKNIRLGFDGGGTMEDTRREIPEKDASYPESTMFGTLPAYGFYCRHVKGLRFSNLQLSTDEPDLRHAMVFDDAEDVRIDGLAAQFSPGAAPMIRMVQTRNALIRKCSPGSATDTLLQLQGDATEGIRLEDSDLEQVREVADISPEVPKDALSQD